MQLKKKLSYNLSECEYLFEIFQRKSTRKTPKQSCSMQIKKPLATKQRKTEISLPQSLLGYFSGKSDDNISRIILVAYDVIIFKSNDQNRHQ